MAGRPDVGALNLYLILAAEVVIDVADKSQLGAVVVGLPHHDGIEGGSGDV